MAIGQDNGTQNFSASSDCKIGGHFVGFALIDILTFVMGQPVTTKLLWLVVTSKKTTDVLNCNLALFHNVQHFVSIFHLICLFVWEKKHMVVVKFLLAYVQTGGPMSLTFICLERYFAVIHPTSYPLLTKYRFREACAVSVWIIALSTAFVTVFCNKSSFRLLVFDLKSIPAGMMVFMMSLMVWCSYKIAKELKKSGPGGDKLHPMKKRALKTVMATSFITVLCYIPVNLMQNLTNEFEIMYDCVATPLSILYLSVASVVHPLFYLSTQGQACPCLRRKKKT